MGVGEMSAEVDFKNITSKLVLLTLTSAPAINCVSASLTLIPDSPNCVFYGAEGNSHRMYVLRVLQENSSPYATAELFSLLKQHYTEPNELTAAAVGAPTATAGHAQLIYDNCRV